MTRLDGLSPKLRIAAEFVMAHPDEVATRALRQVFSDWCAGRGGVGVAECGP